MKNSLPPNPSLADRPLPDYRSCGGLLVALPLWMVANIVATPLVIGLTEVMPYLLTGHGGFEGSTAPFAYALWAAIYGALAGLSVGCAQWLLLRLVLPSATGWIALTSLGWAISGSAGMLVLGTSFAHYNGPESRVLIAGVVCATAIGLAQWLFLRQRQPRYAGWWPLATVLGSIVGFYFARPAWPQEYPQVGVVFIPGFILFAIPNVLAFTGLWLLLNRSTSRSLDPA